jgi:phage terminase large subunit-like protein
MLAQLRRTLGEYNFAGQYQQAPSPQGRRHGQSRVVQELRGERPAEKFDRIMQSWDTANKASELRARPEITESTFDRVKYGFTT